MDADDILKKGFQIYFLFFVRLMLFVFVCVRTGDNYDERVMTTSRRKLA
jgi:hypothetical protein